ncbi:MAG: DUF1080 domain-containing protein [Rubripirellula sp.]|nr:DUF1080 domain-containing protein [Rubripirellula sp.]
MPESNIDPYHKWLGISPKDQPANHYRLLGVDPFETDLDVIESAAARQISHVRSFSLGPHAELSQAVLNQLAKARSTLLNPQTKIAYDQKLKQTLNLGADTQPKQKPQTIPELKSPPSSVPRTRSTRPKSTSRTKSRKATSSKVPVWLYAAGGAALVILPILFFIWNSDKPKQPNSILADSNAAVAEPNASPAAAEQPIAEPNTPANESSLNLDNLQTPQETSPPPSVPPSTSPPTATPANQSTEQIATSSPESTELNRPNTSSIANPSPSNQTDQNPEAEWIELFNGRDLSGWYGGGHRDGQRVSQKRRDEQWKVTNGELRWLGKRAEIDLFTDQAFGNFELSVEWKLPSDGDSGILLRGYPQVQMWDPASRKTPKAAVGSGGLYNNKQHSSTPDVKADRVAGQWNHFLIRMIGNRVTVQLNDRLVVDNVEMEDFRNPRQPIAAKGPIGLQGFSGAVAFRNIRIRELNVDKPTSPIAAQNR